MTITQQIQKHIYGEESKSASKKTHHIEATKSVILWESCRWNNEVTKREDRQVLGSDTSTSTCIFNVSSFIIPRQCQDEFSIETLIRYLHNHITRAINTAIKYYTLVRKVPRLKLQDVCKLSLLKRSASSYGVRIQCFGDVSAFIVQNWCDNRHNSAL
jgi:hypothetical protein